jgi:hypothetical protein
MSGKRVNTPAADDDVAVLAHHEGGSGRIETAGPQESHESLESGVLQHDNQGQDGPTAVDAIITLEELVCLELTNLEKLAEPYIWPVLIWVDDATIQNPVRPILVGTIPERDARNVIKDSMRARETAPIPASVGTLRVRFDPTVDGTIGKHLIVVVALLENDETPTHATLAGFRTFVSSLTAAVISHLVELNNATKEEREAIVEEIKEQVSAAVDSAVKDDLTAEEKAKVFVGLLDPDDSLGGGFVALDNAEIVPGPVTIAIEQTGRLKPPFDNVPTLSRFEIRGRLRLQPVVVDPCQRQVQAVNDAQAVVTGIEQRIEELQDQLTGPADDGGPVDKDGILAEIKRLREEELVPAIAALETARAALVLCRKRTGGVANPNPFHSSPTPAAAPTAPTPPEGVQPVRQVPGPHCQAGSDRR